MFFKDKDVLVTGGTGFVGTNFVEELVRRGARVHVPVHHRPSNIRDERITTFPCDLTKLEECVAACKGKQYVVHAAGAVSAAAVTAGNPMSVITTNLIVSSLMMQAAWTAGVERMLLLGSTTIYPAVNHPIKEEEAWTGPTHPTYFAYGWMRRYLERMAEFVHSKSGTKIALTRPTAVYGRWDDFEPATSHVIPALIRKAVERLDPYEVWGTGDEVRDFVHVSDAVAGGLAALEHAATCDPINLGYGQTVTVKDVVRQILKAANYEDAKVVFNSSKPTTIPFRMVDITKAQTLLGYSPKVSLGEGLADTLNWYKQRQAEKKAAAAE